MEKLIIFTRVLIASQLVLLSAAAVTKLWAVHEKQQDVFSISEKAPEEYIAWASFENTINKTGWANLYVEASNFGQSNNDIHEAYAAGILEGYITSPLTHMHWTNTLKGFCSPPLTTQCQGLKNFLQKNLDWVKNQILLHSSTDSYWYQVQLFLYQIAGFQDGYNSVSKKPNLDIDVFGVYLFQVGGDLEDLMGLFSKSDEASWQQSNDEMGFGTGHCSALILLLNNTSDLYVSQDTWSDLNTMLRILKRYSFNFTLSANSSASIAGRTMTFSSYPGVLMSGDDFYTISSGLVSQETTIGNSNPNLTKYIVPESVLEGVRSMVANRLASTAKEWAEIFSQYNSGTYNNQWMIIDFKKFQAGNPKPVPGLFYLLEQIPHYIHYEDLTHLLYNQSYFGSYNIPYFPDIFNLSGQPAMVKKYGDWFTYDKTPRALIFKRDVHKVIDLDSMTKLMRYNNFQNDPLSKCNCTPPYSAENAISCRDDLNPINGTYAFGALGHRPHIATDMKLTNTDLVKTLSFLAISSPTYDDLPPFQWSKSDYNHKLSHVGHPDLWHFPRILFNGTHPLA